MQNGSRRDRSEKCSAANNAWLTLACATRLDLLAPKEDEGQIKATPVAGATTMFFYREDSLH